MDRVVAIGIDAYASAHPLAQCVRDVTHRVVPTLRQLCPSLMEGRSLRKLLNERATKDNILTRLRWMEQYAESGDRYLFYFSGHGTTVPNSQNEEDGRDEALVPFDYDGSAESVIRDDEFCGLFKLNPSIYRVFFFDSCFSGGMNDMVGKGIGKPKGKFMNAFRGLIPKVQIAQSRAVVIEACGENETAGESENGGRLTSAFFKHFKEEPHAPLRTLLMRTRKSVEGQQVTWAGDKLILSLPFMTKDWKYKC